MQVHNQKLIMYMHTMYKSAELTAIILLNVVAVR